MRVLLTGASGFVGSNIKKVMTDRHGDEVIDRRVDMTDRAAVADHVRTSRPDAVVHCAILNDWNGMHRDRPAAWKAYVEATRNYAEAAADIDVPMCLISTDWVFDGTQSNATEDTPPNPINLYGFLKAASEMVALERGGSVARVMGVNGTHWTRPTTPRAQDPGFGYFVASLVDALENDEPFTVWEGDDINGIASPALASHCGEVVRAIIAAGHGGGTHISNPAIFHCCGAEATSRRRLAEAAVDAFGLDRSLLHFGPAPVEAFAGQRIPFDTSVSARWTADRLGTPLLSLDQLLAAFKKERETGQI